MTYSERTLVLGGALQKLSNKDNWTQGTLARSEDGRQVSPVSPAATQWCAVGAVASVEGTSNVAKLTAIALLNENSRSNSIIDTNDQAGYGPTLEVFQKALCASKKEDA